MNVAIITSGFQSNSNTVGVSANVTDGTVILLYDDETKVLIGSGAIGDGAVSITASPVLYSGQRIIAYVSEFGNDTYGAVIVTESDTENTGWKIPETVDGVPYGTYLLSGGDHLPDLYTPEECRNISRDMDAIERVIDIPITFKLRQIESQAGTIQILIEDIQNAIGGCLVKFDSDPQGTTTSKTYSVNGTYTLKVWGANQTIADAITKTYVLVMPTSTVNFGANVIDLYAQIDFGSSGSPGQKVIMLVAHSTVACELQIDGVFTWTDAIVQVVGLAFRSNQVYISAGTYTIRARNKAVPSEAILRQIKLAF